MVDESPAPPPVADDVEVQARYPRAQRSDRLQRILDLLVRHQPRQHHHSRCGRARAGQRLRRRLVKTVAHHRDPLVVDPERDQITRRRQRHRHVLIAPVHPRRQRRLDKPAQPAEHRPGHRPLLAMAVVHQHHHPPAVNQPGQKRQAVLGVDDDVGSHARAAQPEPRCRHRQQRPDVDRVTPARAADPHAVDHFASRRTGIARGAQRDVDARRRQLRADALQVGFAAAALRVPGIAPAQQQYRAQSQTCGRSREAVTTVGLAGGRDGRLCATGDTARSVRLLSEFRYEQPDPGRFYGALADDTAAMVGDLWRACTANPRSAAACSTSAAGPDISRRPSPTPGCGISASSRTRTKCTPRDRFSPGVGHVRARVGHGAAVRRRLVDICLSSNVAEHVPRPWQLGAEMLRVTRPGGLVVLSYTVWLGPFGGHEMGLTHYLGGERAAARYARKHGHPAEKRLRVVVVRGVGRRRAELGREHRRRWSPLSRATTPDGRGG